MVINRERFHQSRESIAHIPNFPQNLSKFILLLSVCLSICLFACQSRFFYCPIKLVSQPFKYMYKLFVQSGPTHYGQIDDSSKQRDSAIITAFLVLYLSVDVSVVVVYCVVQCGNMILENLSSGLACSGSFFYSFLPVFGVHFMSWFCYCSFTFSHLNTLFCLVCFLILLIIIVITCSIQLQRKVFITRG